MLRLELDVILVQSLDDSRRKVQLCTPGSDAMIIDPQTSNEYPPVSLDLINSPALRSSSDSSSLDFSFTHSSVSPVGSREGLESPELRGCSATEFAAARTTWSSDGAAA